MSRFAISTWFLFSVAVAWLVAFLITLYPTDAQTAALTLALPIMLLVVDPDLVTMGIAVVALMPFLAAGSSLSVSLFQKSGFWLVLSLAFVALYTGVCLLLCLALSVMANNPV